MEVWRYAAKQVCRHAGTQVRRYAGSVHPKKSETIADALLAYRLRMFGRVLGGDSFSFF